MELVKSKMLLAALSQCVADRDKAAANIASILNEGCVRESDNIKNLKKEFEKIAHLELTMEAIQVYYAKHCPLPSQEPEKKENNVDDNNP